jgi:hypothetical protein
VAVPSLKVSSNPTIGMGVFLTSVERSGVHAWACTSRAARSQGCLAHMSVRSKSGMNNEDPSVITAMLTARMFPNLELCQSFFLAPASGYRDSAYLRFLDDRTERRARHGSADSCWNLQHPAVENGGVGSYHRNQPTPAPNTSQKRQTGQQWNC